MGVFQAHIYQMLRLWNISHHNLHERTSFISKGFPWGDGQKQEAEKKSQFQDVFTTLAWDMEEKEAVFFKKIEKKKTSWKQRKNLISNLKGKFSGKWISHMC